MIGIDLGTTNTVVAYTPIPSDSDPNQPHSIHLFEIPQLVDAGVVEKRPVLPSFILIPGSHDVSQESLTLPWNKNNNLAVGEFAKNRGVELPGRLIASSKSWLCHTMIDRGQPILPWESPHEDIKKTPVQASALILEHIRDAWNYEMASEDETLVLENQEILLTVPASFDAVARELTVQAAQLAGLQNITLLEEPQAAFYAWIEAGADQWREKIKVTDLVLVCDVGGGTTDFSLIEVSEEDGELVLERIAVGQHLLVGGDNMDLALAHSLARHLSKGHRLDSSQMRGLWHGCRNAKERIFSDPALEKLPVTILGRGSSLIGGTRKALLKRVLVEQVLLDGFFPYCEKDAQAKTQTSIGLQEIGLAYAADPSVTYHLAQFLTQSRENFTPTAVLFNGGVMKAEKVRNRILEVLSSWQQTDRPGESLRELETHDLDLAVAKGAVYYGLARKGRGIRIRYGLSKTYYIGIAASMPAVPGMPAPIKALCVAPFGMEEGTEVRLEGREFALVVGAPVKFDFLSAAMRHDDIVGTVVEAWEDEIEPIAVIETTLDGDSGQVIPVTMESKVTEVGTLELWCVSKEDPKQRWKLEFNVREMEKRES